MVSSAAQASPPQDRWEVEREGLQVIARFSGRLSTEAGAESVAAFVLAMGEDRIQAVFDIRKMDGYDSGARRAWTHALQPVRDQLESIELRGGNALVRMGGSVMGSLLGVPVSAVK
jgi:hypothetical protein